MLCCKGRWSGLALVCLPLVSFVQCRASEQTHFNATAAAEVTASVLADVVGKQLADAAAIMITHVLGSFVDVLAEQGKLNLSSIEEDAAAPKRSLAFLDDFSGLFEQGMKKLNDMRDDAVRGKSERWVKDLRDVAHETIRGVNDGSIELPHTVIGNGIRNFFQSLQYIENGGARQDPAVREEVPFQLRPRESVQAISVGPPAAQKNATATEPATSAAGRSDFPQLALNKIDKNMLDKLVSLAGMAAKSSNTTLAALFQDDAFSLPNVTETRTTPAPATASTPTVYSATTVSKQLATIETPVVPPPLPSSAPVLPPSLPASDPTAAPVRFLRPLLGRKARQARGGEEEEQEPSGQGTTETPVGIEENLEDLRDFVEKNKTLGQPKGEETAGAPEDSSEAGSIRMGESIDQLMDQLRKVPNELRHDGEPPMRRKGTPQRILSKYFGDLANDE